jgi:hypothetical protein
MPLPPNSYYQTAPGVEVELSPAERACYGGSVPTIQYPTHQLPRYGQFLLRAPETRFIGPLHRWLRARVDWIRTHQNATAFRAAGANNSWIAL